MSHQKSEYEKPHRMFYFRVRKRLVLIRKLSSACLTVVSQFQFLFLDSAAVKLFLNLHFSIRSVFASLFDASDRRSLKNFD